MDSLQLAPVADLLIASYLDTAVHSQQFFSERDYPLTSAAKAHYMRAIVQAELTHHERFALSAAFVESGRVEFLDMEVGETYLLRSIRAVEIEKTLGQNTAMFDSTDMIRSDVRLLVYNFHLTGLDLSVAGTKKKDGGKHLAASGVPTYIGTWPYSSPGGGGPFDQGGVDAFRDLGGMEDLGEEGQE